MLEVKQSPCSHEAMPMRTKVYLLNMAEWNGRDNPGPHWHHTAATPVLEGLAQKFLVHTVF